MGERWRLPADRTLKRKLPRKGPPLALVSNIGLGSLSKYGFDIKILTHVSNHVNTAVVTGLMKSDEQKKMYIETDLVHLILF